MRLGEFFKQAIQRGDWLDICKVYTTITGEAIEPPKPPKPVSLADLEIDASKPRGVDNPVITDIVIPEDADSQIELPPPPKKRGRPRKVAVKQEEAQPSDPTSPANEFHITHASEGSTKRMPLVIPPRGKRQNKFQDDGTIASNEAVDKHPELAVQKIRARGVRQLQLVHVKCSLCGNEADVTPALAVGYDLNPEENTYKCNKCCTGKGRKDLHRQSIDS